MKQVVVLCFALIAAVGFGAPVQKKVAPVAKPAAAPQAPVAATAPAPAVVVTPSGTSSQATATVPSTGRITGILETRPTATYAGDDKYTTENTLGLGYQFNPNFELGAIQYFDTNLSNPEWKGAGVVARDGFIRARLNNLWTNNSGLTFGYEPRVYLPTDASRRDAGMLFAVRNYLKFSQKLSNSVTLHIQEIPIFYAFDRAGSGQRANPSFENRLYLITDINLGGGFALSIPVFFHQTRTRNFAATAANNDKWSSFIYVWPEVTYSLTENLSLGVAYRSENLFKDDLSGADFSNGFTAGALQAIVTMTL